MLEKTKRIDNPLKLITIFCGISIASIYAIKYVNSEYQFIFICFVICFTILLTLLTFVVLLFRPEVLYAPSDYRNDESFLITMKLIETNKRGYTKKNKEENDKKLLT